MSDSKQAQVDNQSESIEEDYGLKKLTIYTLFISISCLLVAAVWYKKDDIPFTAFFNSTVDFIDKSANTVTDSYNSIVNYLSDNNSKVPIVDISNNTQSNPIKDGQKVIVETTIENITEKPVENNNTSSNATVTEQLGNVENSIIESENSSDIDTSVKITDENTQLTESEKATTETTAVINPIDTSETEINASEISISEEPMNDKQQIAENILIKSDADKAELTDVTKESIIPEASSVNTISSTPLVNPPVPQASQKIQYQVSSNYTHPPHHYYAPPPVMLHNNMPQNYSRSANHHSGYINHGSIMEQQLRTFERNMQIQQQMMQQAFRMQSAIFKDADKHHQEMIKRADSWRLESQKRREKYNKSSHYQPAYMN